MSEVPKDEKFHEILSLIESLSVSTDVKILLLKTAHASYAAGMCRNTELLGEAFKKANDQAFGGHK